jgi:hypothetical protein
LTATLGAGNSCCAFAVFLLASALADASEKNLHRETAHPNASEKNPAQQKEKS